MWGAFMNDRFRGKMVEKNYKRKDLALMWGVDVMTVSNKMTGKSSISCGELATAARFYGLSDAEVLYILFGERVLTDPQA